MEKGTRNCEDHFSVQLSDVQVGLHKVSNSGFYLKITLFTTAKDYHFNFTEDTGYKLVLVEGLQDSVSVNLWAGGSCKWRDYNGERSLCAYSGFFLFPWHQLLATIGDKVSDYSYFQRAPIPTAILTTVHSTQASVMYVPGWSRRREQMGSRPFYRFS